MVERPGASCSAFTPQFFFEGLFPFVVLIVVSLLTKPTDLARGLTTGDIVSG